MDSISDSENKIVINDDLQFHCGDLEKRRIFLHDGTNQILWVTPSNDTTCRKIFLQILVKRISAIDNVEEQYRMKFIIKHFWAMKESEYIKYYKYYESNKLYEYEPLWHPRLEFQNAIEKHSLCWISYNETIGNFKVIDNPFINNKSFTPSKFICCKLECDITFAEELELQSFPFDCQDLTCAIIENSNNVKCEFLPFLVEDKINFATIDPKYSIIDEWDLESSLLEFGKFNEGTDEHGAARIVLRYDF